jgi:hypothetical protein
MGKVEYSGLELEGALATGELEDTASAITVMVRASTKAGHVAVSLTGCAGWVDLPTEMIERAESKGRSTCGDHSHPVVALSLRPPTSEEGRLMFGLLMQAATGTIPQPPLSLPTGMSPIEGASISDDANWFQPLQVDSNEGRWLKCYGGTTSCGPGGVFRCGYECCRNGPNDRFVCRLTGPATLRKATLQMVSM